MWTWECCNGLGYRTGGIVDRSSYCLLLNDEVCSNTAKPWNSYDSTYDPKSQQLLPRECQYWIEHTDYEWLLFHEGSFSYCVEKYHTTLFHTQPPQNQYSRTPHLNKSSIASSPPSFTMSTRFTIDSWLSVKHTKPVKAPAYTCALPDIGNLECISTLPLFPISGSALVRVL